MDVFFFNYTVEEAMLMSPYEISQVIHSFYDHGLLGSKSLTYQSCFMADLQQSAIADTY